MSEVKEKLVCGIVMPIASCDGCPESHWSDVYQIINDAVTAAGFEANLVSNANEVGVIHKRIIENLYDNPIVVCDVSGKNPNVMFELGMRLAFDKPTVIIKDEKTLYSFDTAGIEHIPYQRDLRFSSVVDFKNKLTQKIMSTYKKSIDEPTYSTFLKHFGEFKVAKLDKKEVPGQEFILEELKRLGQTMQGLMIQNSKVHEFTHQAFLANSQNSTSDVLLNDLIDNRRSATERLRDAARKNNGLINSNRNTTNAFSNLENYGKKT